MIPVSQRHTWDADKYHNYVVSLLQSMSALLGNCKIIIVETLAYALWLNFSLYIYVLTLCQN